MRAMEKTLNLVPFFKYKLIRRFLANNKNFLYEIEKTLYTGYTSELTSRYLYEYNKYLLKLSEEYHICFGLDNSYLERVLTSRKRKYEKEYILTLFISRKTLPYDLIRLLKDYIID